MPERRIRDQCNGTPNLRSVSKAVRKHCQKLVHCFPSPTKDMMLKTNASDVALSIRAVPELTSTDNLKSYQFLLHEKEIRRGY